MLALSTLYRAHRRDGTFFICRNRGDVFLFNLRQRSVREVWIGFVPVETRKVLLQPRLLEHLPVPRVDLVPHLTHVFDEQSLQQRARDRLRAELLVNAVLEFDDCLDVDLVIA